MTLLSRHHRWWALGGGLVIFFGIGIVAMLARGLGEHRDHARINGTRSIVSQVAGAISEYREVTGGLPPDSNRELVAALSQNRPGKGPYILFDQTVPLSLGGEIIDRWERRLIYRRTKEGYLLYSTGPDGRDDGGGGDDIRP